MPCLHSLRSWAIYFTFARLRLGQIIFIGALINCLSLNNPLITTITSSCKIALFKQLYFFRVFGSSPSASCKAKFITTFSTVQCCIKGFIRLNLLEFYDFQFKMRVKISQIAYIFVHSKCQVKVTRSWYAKPKICYLFHLCYFSCIFPRYACSKLVLVIL